MVDGLVESGAVEIEAEGRAAGEAAAGDLDRPARVVLELVAEVEQRTAGRVGRVERDDDVGIVDQVAQDIQAPVEVEVVEGRDPRHRELRLQRDARVGLAEAAAVPSPLSNQTLLVQRHRHDEIRRAVVIQVGQVDVHPLAAELRVGHRPGGEVAAAVAEKGGDEGGREFRVRSCDEVDIAVGVEVRRAREPCGPARGSSRPSRHPAGPARPWSRAAGRSRSTRGRGRATRRRPPRRRGRRR